MSEKEPVAQKDKAGLIKQGKEFLQVVELFQGGKKIAGAPKSGKYTVRMKRKVTFHGNKTDAENLLSLVFPGCTFELDLSKPAEPEKKETPEK